MKIAALADTHVQESSKGLFNEFFTEIGSKADVLLLCGDLTDRGTPEEAAVLCEEIRDVRIPIIVVLGNHDFHSDQQEEITTVLKNAGVIVLDKEQYEYNDVGFAGVKGFMGGFDNLALGSFGEAQVKEVVAETDREAYKLEDQLKGIKSEHKVVLMHYSPIKETLQGEPAEIHAFLGATRFAQVIDQFGGTIVFHGHAHYGSHEGKTGKGIPVYNVSLPVMKKKSPKDGYALIELPQKT